MCEAFGNKTLLEIKKARNIWLTMYVRQQDFVVPDSGLKIKLRGDGYIGENLKNVMEPYNICKFVAQLASRLICSTLSMFSTKFKDISLVFVQLCLDCFGKITKDHPFYYLGKNTHYHGV